MTHQSASSNSSSGLGTAKFGAEKIEADCRFLLGWFFLSQGDCRKAIESYLAAAAVYEDLGKSREVGECYKKIALGHLYLLDFKNALQFRHRADEIDERTNERSALACNSGENTAGAQCQSGMGWAFGGQPDVKSGCSDT